MSKPRSLVALLFTDIEASVALSERAGEQYNAALQRHHELVRDEVTRHDGREFHEAGDSFCLAFDDLPTAVLTAVAIQQKLNREAWPPAIGALRVRMALHFGSADFREGQYRGPLMHCTARILGAAHGGQILCSGAAAEALAACLPEKCALRELGLFRLRDIARPEGLWQLSYPGMPRADFPPVRATPAYVQNLPVQLTSFFGRENEIAELEKLIESQGPQAARLVTLTGPGGIGKSRLSIAVAERLSAARWLVAFVPLADVRDARLLPKTVHDALGLPADTLANPLEEIVSFLNSQPSLLVLDNFEQLALEGGDFLVTLQRLVPGLRCLVSSRQKLALPGEREFPVSPLPIPASAAPFDRLGTNASVRLFADRAQGVRADFQITDANAPDVAGICSLLEGIPLAIELAAARIQVLTVQELHAQLKARLLSLPADASASRPARHRTLHAAIDWSYDSLLPDQQRFFATLGVFRGGFTASAAAFVAGELPESVALNHLYHLRCCSFILTDEGRHGMRCRLLETIREYAEERLMDLADAARERHARYFRKFAAEGKEKLKGAGQTEWMKRLELDHDNLRACLDFSRHTDEERYFEVAAHLQNFWGNHGDYQEGIHWLERVLDRAIETRLQVAAATACGGFHIRAGRSPEAAVFYERAFACAKQHGMRDAEAVILTSLALIANEAGRHDEAERLTRESLAILRELHLPLGEHQALANLGLLKLTAGKLSEAEKCFLTSLDWARKHGITDVQIATAGNLALVMADLGQYGRGLDYLNECLGLTVTSGIRNHLQSNLGIAGYLLAAIGNFEEAVWCLAASERARNELHQQQSDHQKNKTDVAADRARHRLGSNRYAAAWEHGQTLSLEDLLERLRETALPHRAGAAKPCV